MTSGKRKFCDPPGEDYPVFLFFFIPETDFCCLGGHLRVNSGPNPRGHRNPRTATGLGNRSATRQVRPTKPFAVSNLSGILSLSSIAFNYRNNQTV